VGIKSEVIRPTVRCHTPAGTRAQLALRCFRWPVAVAATTRATAKGRVARGLCGGQAPVTGTPPTCGEPAQRSTDYIGRWSQHRRDAHRDGRTPGLPAASIRSQRGRRLGPPVGISPHRSDVMTRTSRARNPWAAINQRVSVRPRATIGSPEGEVPSMAQVAKKAGATAWTGAWRLPTDKADHRRAVRAQRRRDRQQVRGHRDDSSPS